MMKTSYRRLSPEGLCLHYLHLNPLVNYLVSNSPTLVIYLARLIQSLLSNPIYLRYILILLLNLQLGFPRDIYSSVSLKVLLFISSIRVTFSVHIIFLPLVIQSFKKVMVAVVVAVVLAVVVVVVALIVVATSVTTRFTHMLLCRVLLSCTSCLELSSPHKNLVIVFLNRINFHYCWSVCYGSISQLLSTNGITRLEGSEALSQSLNF